MVLASVPYCSIEPQRHREHRANFVLARSGDDDRAKELSPPGRFFGTNDRITIVGVGLKELPPKAEALFPGRRLPAREKSISSVSSVSPW